MLSGEASDRTAERRAMVEEQLRWRGVADERVLRAMQTVPRHLFVPASHQYAAYEDRALSIGEAQTISQPYMIARSCELAEVSPDDHVLEVGAGSGYQAAVLAQLAEDVVGIELIPTLAERARSTIGMLGYDNVEIVIGDGTQGYPARAPYDAIVVAAGAASVPQALLQQLAVGGRLVIPIGEPYFQVLRLLRKTPRGVEEHAYEGCVFVPLVGSCGWARDAAR